MPTAGVSYGFRGTTSVQQAFKDALYKGPRTCRTTRSSPASASTLAGRRQRAASMSAETDRETLLQYVGDASRRGEPLPGGFDGAAGGAPCGDLVRISIAVESGRIARVSFDAEGCAAANAAAAAVAELAEGEAVLDAALIGPEHDRRAARRGSARRDATRSSSPPTRFTGRSPGRPAPGVALAAPPASGERVLVALSGGVDSAVAALRERERGAEVVAVTLKLWSDQRTDASKSCCSPLAVLGARGLAHSLGIPHLTLDLEHGVPRARRRRLRRRLPRRADPEPVRGLQRRAAYRRDARARRAARLRRARDRPLRADRRRRRGPAARRRRRPGQGSDLHALRPAAGFAGAAAVPARRADEARGSRARRRAPACAVASKAESQDLCFLAGEGKRSFLARHGGLDERPGEIVDRRGRRLGRHRGHHEFTVGQRRGLGVGSHEAALRAGDRRGHQHRRRRFARRAGDRPGRRSRGDPAPARRPRRPGAAALPLAPARLHARRRRGRQSRRSSSSSSPSPPTESPPARPRACSAATSSSAARRSPERPQSEIS